MKYNFKENTIYCGDNLRVLHDFPEECVDLIYIDPPFMSGRNYDLIFDDKFAMRAFEDTFNGSMESYLTFMEERIRASHRVLKPTGSFYLHCDWHAGHYLKVLCDKIFGMKNFQNEIIWSYRTGGASNKRYGRKHDIILFYTKGNKWIFHAEKEKAYTKSKSRKAGIINYGGGKAEFFEDENGVYNLVNMRDVWEISYINSQSKERLGYPTQKPETLLERIIKASSNEGDIVADFFCGCGTTLAVAKRLKRKWIGVDVSPIAYEVCSKRLKRG